MKNMSFKILTALLFGLLFSLSLSIGYVNNAYSQVNVIEEISWDPATGIYTYTYTLRNLGKKQVWWWGIFYSDDPEAILDVSSTAKKGFVASDLTDCSPGWISTAPPFDPETNSGRMGFYMYNDPATGDVGFYSTLAHDAESGNKVPSTADMNSKKIGGPYGWDGYGAQIVTAYGIHMGQEGYYVIKSTKPFPESKEFFYNTTDYWNSYIANNQRVIGGFEFTSAAQQVLPIPITLSKGYNHISLPVAELMGSVTSYQASTLLRAIPGCKNVSWWDPLAQRTEYQILSGDNRISGTIDFMITPGEGYFVEASAATTFNFYGLTATEPQPLTLTEGYNDISLIYGPKMPGDYRTGYTASTLLKAIPGCKKVIRYKPSSQKTENYGYFFGEPSGTNFDILVGEGYMVEVSNDTTWTPVNLSLPSKRLRQADEDPSYSLTIPAPIISNIKESYQTSGSVVISWLTDTDSLGEVHYSTNSNLAQYLVVKDTRVGKVHRVELSGLQSGIICYYEVKSGAAKDNNGGHYYAYTPLQPSAPLGNNFVGGQVLKEDQSPLSGALVFVTINHQGVNSYPVSTVTNTKGIWFVNLADLRDSSTGDSLPSSSEDQIIIEVDGGYEWQMVDSTRLVSDLAEESGYTLSISYTPPLAPPLVAIPVLSPATGNFTSLPIRVTITCDTPGSLIHYTTDGSEPLESSPAYASPMILNLTGDTTVKAKGFKSGFTPSNPVAGTYKYLPPPCGEPVAKPILSPASGDFTDSMIVQISCATAGATIYYTKDGTEPTTSSLVYNAPLTLTKTRTIKAKAFKTGCTTSETASGTYNKTAISSVDKPTISSVSRTFSDSMSVSMSCTTEGAVIRYTTDGSEPTDNSPAYTTPVTLTKTATVKAKGFKSGSTPSDTASVTYTAKVATPALSPAPGTFSSPTSVSMSCATQGTAIRYTIDGTEPTASSPAYAAALTLTAGNTTIKAKGFKDGCETSDTVSGTYTVTISCKVAAPVLSPASGSATSVKITCATQGANIYYTIDGSVPTEKSSKFTAPVTITKNTTIKAKAFKSECTESDTASGTYTYTPPQPSIGSSWIPFTSSSSYTPPLTWAINQTPTPTWSSSFNWMNYQSTTNPYLGNYSTFSSGLF